MSPAEGSLHAKWIGAAQTKSRQTSQAPAPIKEPVTPDQSNRMFQSSQALDKVLFNQKVDSFATEIKEDESKVAVPVA